MPVPPPEVRLQFENSRGELSRIAEHRLIPYSEGVENVLENCLLESFGTLVIEVYCSSAQKIAFLVNGKDVKSRSIGNIKMLRLPIDRDLAFHRVSVVSPPAHALTFDLSVEHHYQPAGCGEPSGITKWKLPQFKAELSKYKRLFGQANQRAFLPDIQNSGIRKGADEAAQLLLQVIGRLEVTISTATVAEAGVDFHVSTPGDFDRDAILSALKQNPRHLTPSAAGSIRFKGGRYTTALGQRHLQRTSKVDFSGVVFILKACAMTVRRSAAPAISAFLLMNLVEEIRFRFPSSFENRNTEAFGDVLERVAFPLRSYSPDSPANPCFSRR